MKTEELKSVRQDLKDALVRVDRLLLADGFKIPLKEIDIEKQADYVLDVICEYAHITRETLVYRGRKSNIIEWRRIACYILVDYVKMTLESVTKKLEFSTHPNTIHHRDMMRKWMAEPKFAPSDVYIATINILYKLGYENIPRN